MTTRTALEYRLEQIKEERRIARAECNRAITDVSVIRWAKHLADLRDEQCDLLDKLEASEARLELRRRLEAAHA